MSSVLEMVTVDVQFCHTVARLINDRAVKGGDPLIVNPPRDETRQAWLKQQRVIRFRH